MLTSIFSNPLSAHLKKNKFPEPRVIWLHQPVLLCHGYGALAGFTKPSPMYDVAIWMRRHNVLAFAPNIEPYATNETRAKGWVRIIHKLTDSSHIKKLNVVAHSMGGLDMRYALDKLQVEDRVESLTTISTAHRGTSLAELALRAPGHEAIGHFLNWMAERLYPASKSNAVASARQLTRAYMQDTFNPSVSKVPDMPCYSFGSAVGKGTDEPVSVMSRYQNNYIFEQEGPNDSMVSVKSARWREYIATGHLSHLEQLNIGLKKKRRPLFDAFWLKVLHLLQERGH